MGMATVRTSHGKAGGVVAQTHQLPDDGSWQGDILQEIAAEHEKARRERMADMVPTADVAKALRRHRSSLVRSAGRLGVEIVRIKNDRGQEQTYMRKAEALRLARLLGGQEE